eukprot:gene11941-13916_t
MQLKLRCQSALPISGHYICTGSAGVLKPGCSKCRLRDPADRLLAFDHYLGSHVLAQESAQQIVRNAIAQKITQPNNPTVLMLTGDHGLGKTSTARLISKSLFRLPGANDIEGDGILLVHGEDFKRVKKGNEAAVSKSRDLLREKIAEQLFACPDSVIVLDEIQKIHPLILSVLEPFFEGLPTTHNKMSIQTNKAIYVLTSDFERAGTTVDKTLEELKELTITNAKLIYQDFKLMNLVTHIVPFMPLTQGKAASLFVDRITAHMCNNLRKLGLRDIVLNDVLKITHILTGKMERLYESENFRGLEKVLNTYIFDGIQFLSHMV